MFNPMKKSILVLFCLWCMFVGLVKAQTGIAPTKQTRTYSGTVTTYPAGGPSVAGIINVELDPDGKISAQIIMSGVTSSYLGALADTSRRTGAGSVIAVDDLLQPIAGASRIPLFVTKTLVYGGLLDENGNGLVLRSERGTISTGQTGTP